MGCGEARGALLGCRHVVLYAVVLFGALGVVEAIQRAYQVASDAAELLLMRFMPYRNRAKPPNSPNPICNSSSTYASPSRGPLLRGTDMAAHLAHAGFP